MTSISKAISEKFFQRQLVMLAPRFCNSNYDIFSMRHDVKTWKQIRYCLQPATKNYNYIIIQTKSANCKPYLPDVCMRSLNKCLYLIHSRKRSMEKRLCSWECVQAYLEAKCVAIIQNNVTNAFNSDQTSECVSTVLHYSIMKHIVSVC